MIPGIETAGLVLATFPIVISFLEHYVKGVETIQKWRFSSRELAIYARKLEVQRVTYLNTTEKLLDGIVESDDDLATMLSNPESVAWQKFEYTDPLRTRLHHSYDVYFARTHDMMQNLEGLKTKLGIDASGKVAWDNFTSLKRQIKRLKIALTKTNCDELLSEIGVANRELQNLVDQNLGLEPQRSQRRLRGNAAAFRLIRQHARSLHATILLDSSWKCKQASCRRRHRVSLRLEPRQIYCKQTTSSHEMTDVRFGVLLWTDADQEEVRDLTGGRRFEVRPVEEPRPDTLPNAIHHPTPTSSRRQRIVSFELPNRRQSLPNTAVAPEDIFSINRGRRSVGLCGELLGNASPNDKLGFLEDDTVGKYQHHLSCREVLEPSTCLRSLRHLLKITQLGDELYSWGNRLYLALTLASSVLQLDETPWLPKNWRSKNIFILHTSQPTSRTQDPVQSYLSCEVLGDAAEANAASTSRAATYITRSEVLLSLGIVLTELGLAKTLEDLQIPRDSETNVDESVRRIIIARRLLGEVETKAGTPYRDVVQRCLDCSFNVREANLENEEFHQEVFAHIVTPLSQDWRSYSGLR